jgi:hypothetical protein
VVSASSIGAVGTDWQTVGIAAYQSAGAAIMSSASSASTDGGHGGFDPSSGGPAFDSAGLGLWAGSALVGQSGGADTDWFERGQTVAGSISGFSPSAGPAAQAGTFEPSELSPGAALLASNMLQHPA